MATPTITSVSPSVIFTGGQLFTVIGTNFQVPYDVPTLSTGPLPSPLPTVEVKVGNKVAQNVQVYSVTELTARIGPLDPASYSVTVTNLDEAGVPISGETATKAAAVTAKRADLAYDNDFTRLERTLILELRRQVIENVLKTVSVDYDGTPAGAFDMTEVGKLPALVLQGPQVVDNRFYDLDVSPVFSDGNGGYVRRRTFKTVNLTYRFVGMDDKQARNMNIMALMLQFLQNNPLIEMVRNIDDSSKGVVQYELAQVGEFTTFTGSSESDIRGFSGSLVIRGFQIEDVTGFLEQTVAERGGTVDNVNVPPVGIGGPTG